MSAKGNLQIFGIALLFAGMLLFLLPSHSISFSVSGNLEKCSTSTTDSCVFVDTSPHVTGGEFIIFDSTGTTLQGGPYPLGTYFKLTTVMAYMIEFSTPGYGVPNNIVFKANLDQNYSFIPYVTSLSSTTTTSTQTTTDTTSQTSSSTTQMTTTTQTSTITKTSTQTSTSGTSTFTTTFTTTSTTTSYGTTGSAVNTNELGIVFVIGGVGSLVAAQRKK